MAKKDQNVMLLQEVVGQLRKLNAGSVRDRLREAEEAKRAEQIALQGEVQEEQQASIVSSGEDFRRRFIAGQAKTFTDRTTGGSAQRDISRNQLLDSINKGLISPKTDSFTGLIKVNTDSLVQNLSTLKNINFQMLEFMKTSRKEDDLRFNTQTRLQEEARKEAIELNKKPLAGTGSQSMPELDLNDPSSSGAGVGIGAAASIIALKAWKWSKLKAAAFLAWGKKLFSKFKLTPKQTKMLVNPRKWPLVLAGVLAAGFLGMKFLGDEGEDTSDGSVLPGDLEDLPPESALASNMDTLFTVALTGGLLSKSKIVQNVAKSVGDKVRNAYKSAPKTSLRGRLYANPAFQKGLKLGGRGLLRFMGPWGVGAWIAWELSSFALKKFSNQEKEGEAALKEIEDLQMSDVTTVLGDPQLEAMFSDPSGPGNRAGAAQKGTVAARIRALMEGKSQAQKDALKKELGKLGWTDAELAPLMGGLSSTPFNPENQRRQELLSKLEVQENNRSKEFGMSPGAMGGIINSGNNIVGDSITQIHNYIQGNPGGGSAWEGKPGGGIGGGGRY